MALGVAEREIERRTTDKRVLLDLVSEGIACGSSVRAFLQWRQRAEFIIRNQPASAREPTPSASKEKSIKHATQAPGHVFTDARLERLREVAETNLLLPAWVLDCVKELQRLRAAHEPRTLPEVAGDSLPTTLAQFEQRCKVLLADEQEKPSPDNALIGLLCDAVRLARENERMAKAGITPPPPATPYPNRFYITMTDTAGLRVFDSFLEFPDLIPIADDRERLQRLCDLLNKQTSPPPANEPRADDENDELEKQGLPRNAER